MAEEDVEIKFAADLADVKKELESLRSDINAWAEDVKTVGVSAFAAWAATKAFDVLKAAFGEITSLIKDAIDAVRGWVEAAAESEMVGVKLDLAVRNAGESFGFTADEVKQMATDLSNISIFDDESIMQAATMTAQLGLTRDAFADVLEVAVDMGSISGDVASSARTLAMAMQYPERAMLTLRREGVIFTAQQREQIKEYVKFGEESKAQAIILDTVRDKFKGAREAMKGTFTGMLAEIKNVMGDIQEELGKGFLEFIKNILPAIKELLMYARELAKTFGDWLASLAGADTTKSMIDNLNEGIRQLVGYTQAFFESLPVFLKDIYAQLKFMIADITVDITALSPTAGVSGALENAQRARDDALFAKNAAAADTAIAMKETIPGRAAAIAKKIGSMQEDAEDTARSNKLQRQVSSTWQGIVGGVIDTLAPDFNNLGKRIMDPGQRQKMFGAVGLPGAGVLSEFFLGGAAGALAPKDVKDSRSKAKELTELARAAGVPEFKEDQYKYKPEFLSAEALFQRISGGGVAEKQLDTQQKMLQEMRDAAIKEVQKNKILEEIKVGLKDVGKAKE